MENLFFFYFLLNTVLTKCKLKICFYGNFYGFFMLGDYEVKMKRKVFSYFHFQFYNLNYFLKIDKEFSLNCHRLLGG